MRLTDESTAKFEIKSADEQVRKIKQYINDCQVRFGKIMGCGTCKALQLCTWTKELCDTIECMRKHIEALQQENEQLNTQIKNWETNYNNLLAEYEEMAAVANKKEEELDRLREKVRHIIEECGGNHDDEMGE